ncbi:penicillin-binding protein 2 [Clostridium bowmanii]|uniref:penicillin-binding transpeptidase domain-containing protein n=1 Tax=Clostridium bowmanii TaxID=132925 RepID=UPI001C0DCC36|nr:penicillin-binding transpeptidase domain-containing protein [Clostridium bowmanii]MBU3191268.1 penicillin-binding protein 2 [Clostridium bowmanii]MCA1075717.1 penicillin-binding protein 2 [Clostridium bowmanii]
MYSRNNIFGSSNQRRENQKRTWMLMIIFMLLFCFLIWKIVNYMYFKAEPLKAMFNAQYTIDEKYGLQYNLLDRNNVPLLEYNVNYYAIIDPVDYFRFNEYTSKFDLQALTFTLRNYNSNYDLEKLKGNSNGEKIKYKVDEVTFEKLKDIKKVRGFYTYAANEIKEDNNKYWNIENILTKTKYNKNSIDPITKKYFSKLVSKSADSLEMQIYNKTKNNEFTKIRFVKGVDGEISEGKIIEPEKNINVRLTLDKEIQDSALDILHEKKYEKYDQIGVVLMESSTGKIRAMAQKDDSLSNANLGYPSTYGAYPGSIFKSIVEEAGLDMDLINKNEIYTIIPGLFPEDSHNYNNKNKFTVGEAFRDSSNNIFAQLGWKVGFQNIYNYAENQGMLNKVLNLEQEQSGKFEVGLSSPQTDLSQTAIGQKIRITPIQAISIPNTITNNGIYVKPSIIDAYVNGENKVLERITSKTYQVLKKETAREVKLDMMDVVKNGTGREAIVKDMDIGGKTGTSMYLEEGIKYYDGWFVGFFNLRGKNYSMVVFVNKIDKEESGGSTAAPIFKEIVNAFKDMD